MVYRDLSFPARRARPFFYTNFVQTVDGKVQVLTDGRAYWPIGGATDYATLVGLRAHADTLVHGKHTGMWMRHLDRLGAPSFQDRRAAHGKTRDLLYIVISAHPDPDLAEFLGDPPRGVGTLLATTRSATVPQRLAQAVEVVRLGEDRVDLIAFSAYLHEGGYRHILVEGGPTLLAGFLAVALLDEIFVTIAPKIVGNRGGATLTMVEGHLFPPEEVKKLRLLSVSEVEDEVYLRYRVREGRED